MTGGRPSPAAYHRQRMGRVRTLAAAGLAVAALALVGVVAAGNAGAVLAPQPPDLDQVTPYRVSAFAERRRGRTRLHLAFGSASQNVGQGPLIVVGRRASRRTPLMTADQVLDTGDPDTDTHGPQQTVRAVGVLRYTVSPDHSHWHFLGFMRYELRRASDFRRVGRDRKTGFCLGDRYAVGRFSRAGRAASAPRVTYRDFDTDCGKGRPRLTRIVEGISVGKGDDYKPRLEGQSIDVTAVPSGRYVLVHRTNEGRRIRESGYANNAASVLISLRRRGAARPPTVRVLKRCPDTARCR